jgi:hypothetical protein
VGGGGGLWGVKLYLKDKKTELVMLPKRRDAGDSRVVGNSNTAV